MHRGSNMTFELSHSLWHDTCREEVVTSALSEDVTVDLAIVGGGVTGCSAALQAAQDGASVCLIEANEIGHGGSGRNVGLVNAGLWLPPEEIIKKIGKAAGERLSSVLAQGPDVVFDLIDRFGIACEPVRQGTLHCGHAPRGMKDLANRYAQLRAIGAPVELLGRDEAVARTGTAQVHGALFDRRAGTIQPLSYVRGLARTAIDSGAKLFENTPGKSISQSAEGWQIKTPDGFIRAKALILATNAYHQNVQGQKSQAIILVHYFQAATEPLSTKLRKTILPGLEGCWDSALVMSSWRLDQAGRMIIGGMGDLGHAGTATHIAWLNRKLAKMFPALAGQPLRQTWFGRIAMTADHLPRILQLGETGLITFGYSGRGIGPGTVFGQRMAKALLSGAFSDLPVEPINKHTLPFAGLRQTYYETGATLTHLFKDRI